MAVPGKKRRKKRVTTEWKRLQFMKVDRIKCCFCPKMLTFMTATIEHVIPLSLGGANHPSNFNLSCFDCNQDRGVIPFEDYLRRPPKPPEVPKPRKAKPFYQRTIGLYRTPTVPVRRDAEETPEWSAPIPPTSKEKSCARRSR